VRLTKYQDAAEKTGYITGYRNPYPVPDMPTLNDTDCRNSKPSLKPVGKGKERVLVAVDGPYRLADGGGLFLEVRPNGSKLWRYRYEIAGRENMLALGDYPAASLADARKARDMARELVRRGIHPAHVRQAERAVQIAANEETFKAVALEWIDQLKAKGRTALYTKQVGRDLEVYVFPTIGALPCRAVTSAHLLAIIKRVEKRAPVTAGNLRQWCGAIFRYAIATLRADVDPASALKGAIHRPKIEHHKPLSRNEIPEFLKALATYRGNRATVIALRLLLLTFVRPGELRAAEWTEFDLDGAEWRIPAERMKMREAHTIPLSAQAVALLRELHDITGRQRWLFPNTRRPAACMTGTTTNRALEYLGYAGRFSSHGFRSTASTILNEMGYRPDVIERQLAHKERNQVRAAYNRAQYLPERRQMLMDWADMVDAWETGSNVLPGKFVGDADEVAWAMYRARTRNGTDVDAIGSKK